MTIAVAGTWELGYSVPLSERDLWRYMLQEFQVDKWYMEPISGIYEDRVTEVASLAEVLATNELTVVFVDERGETPLREFEHPENALYVTGKSGQSLMPTYIKPGDLSVVIETPENTGLLWPHQALPIILYDRMAKLWQ